MTGYRGHTLHIVHAQDERVGREKWETPASLGPRVPYS
jgi:hypothetical protein